MIVDGKESCMNCLNVYEVSKSTAENEDICCSDKCETLLAEEWDKETEFVKFDPSEDTKNEQSKK
ncbi:hypothetical protein ACI2JA_03720 [Alkalihalobacillus sp. NPDC078783]